MVRDELIPIVEIDAAEQRMRSAICTEIAVAVGFEKIDGHFARGGEHFDVFGFVFEKFLLHLKRRFDLEQTIARNPHGKVNSLKKRHRCGSYAQNTDRILVHGAFNHVEVGREFGGGPDSGSRVLPPATLGNGV